QTMTQLIVFRALQGLGAGIGIALAFTVVADLFPPAERAKWQGIIASAYAVSSVIGPFLGGWLADHGPLVGSFVTDDTRWRWVFYVNLPVGLLAVAALVVYLPAKLTQHSTSIRGWAAVRRIDFLGALFAAAATVCLLLGLTWGGEQTYAWNSPQVIGTLAGAAVLYVAFFVAERFAVEPILPVGLFRNQVFAADSALSLAAGMAFVPLFIYLPLFLQGILGESATNAGLVSTPMSIAVVIGAFLATGLIAKLRRYQAITFIGGCVFTVGVFLLARMTPSTTLLQAGTFMVIAGIGLGTFFAVMTLIAQNAVPQAQLGVATSSIRYLQALGSTIGTAIIGTVVNNSLAAELTKRIPASTAQQLTPEGLKYATSPQVLVSADYRNSIVHTAQQFAVNAATQGVPPGPQHDTIEQQVGQQTLALLEQVFGAVRDALAIALQHGFVVVLVFCGLCLLSILFLKDVPMSQTAPTETVADTSDAPVLAR
ncbi:MAG TPA: MFS transporter, partial [Ktedonobacterales bacterium]|nr:MFS transporter [Ktedonobacterales bacterium]